MYTNIAELESTIAVQAVLIAAYGRSHLGILSGPAIRHELAQLTTPVDLLCFDWRKQNEWNKLLGWGPANVQLGQAARADYAGIDRRRSDRVIDLRGQYGGDEIVMAVDPGHGVGLLARVLRELISMNADLTTAQHAAITKETGGVISGFCIAAVLVRNTSHALADTVRAIDMTGTLKAGNSTGCRATSGRSGTRIACLNASI